MQDFSVDQLGSLEFWQECLRDSKRNREWLGKETMSVTEIQYQLDHYEDICRRMIAMLRPSGEASDE